MKKPKLNMQRIDSLFDMKAAMSNGIKDYDIGEIPFVTSTELNNGVVAYVEPDADDRIFIGPLVSISGLGHATVQLNKFLPKGNGGDSLTILTPKSPVSVDYLVSFCALFNLLHQWRFSFGRKCSISRLCYLTVPYPFPSVKSEWSSQHELIQSISSSIMKILQDSSKTT